MHDDLKLKSAACTKEKSKGNGKIIVHLISFRNSLCSIIRYPNKTFPCGVHGLIIVKTCQKHVLSTTIQLTKINLFSVLLSAILLKIDKKHKLSNRKIFKNSQKFFV